MEAFVYGLNIIGECLGGWLWRLCGRMTIRVSIATALALPLIAAAGLPAAAVRKAKEEPLDLVGESVILDDVPPGKAGCNGYIRGLAAILESNGIDADYDTLMGDSGLAFILQAERNGSNSGEAPDMGYWPEAPWGFLSRVEFLGQTVGCDLLLTMPEAGAFENPAEHYQNHWQPFIEDSIAAHSPLLGILPNGFLITGYDQGDPPLLGIRPGEDQREPSRATEYPWALLSVDDATAPLDRRKADIQALHHAVALGRRGLGLDASLGSLGAPQSSKRCFTGRRAWMEWQHTLREGKPMGEAEWHAQMCQHIRINRESAVRYLRAMAKRHPEPVAANIRLAFGFYERILAELSRVDTREEVLASPQGREAFLNGVAYMSNLERLAVDALATALADAGGDVPCPNGSFWPAEKAPRQVLLSDLPSMEGFAQPYDFDIACLTAILRHAGANVGYNTLMGDSGRAFIFQVAPYAPSLAPAVLRPDSLKPWGFLPRLDFMSRAIGREIKATVIDLGHIEGNELNAFNRERIMPIVDAELTANRPLLAIDCTSYVIVGYQTASSGKSTDFLGMRPGATHDFISTEWEPVLGVAAVGREIAQMDRRQADIEALQHAVALGRDTAFTTPGEGGLPYLTGQRALRHWVKLMRDDTQRTDPYGQTTLCAKLAMNRRSAVAYLRAMATRHKPDVAKRLDQAADLYEKAINELALVERSNETDWASPEERERLAQTIERAMVPEAKAIVELEQALGAMGAPLPPTQTAAAPIEEAKSSSPISDHVIELHTGDDGPPSAERILVDGHEAATWEDLEEILADLHEKEPNAGLVVRATPTTPVTAVMRLMKIAKSAGFERVAITAAPGQEPTHHETEEEGGTVKQEGDRVCIEGVEGFSSAEYASSVHGAQARVLETLGADLTYDDLICYGTFAFRTGWHEAGCPSAGHPCCGFMCIDNANRAIPWDMKVYESFPGAPDKDDRAAFEAEVCAAVKASIDRGIPVHYSNEEDGLIIGYADEGRRWWCIHPYHKEGAEAFWYDEAQGFAGGKWPWVIAIWSEPTPEEERLSKRDLTRTALEQAVEMWSTEKRGAYFTGEAAYAHWLEWLRAIDAGEVDDPKIGMQGNGWCFDVLIHSRRIAARWLEEKAEEFGGKVGQKLRAAAGHYRQTIESCMKGLDNPWQLALPPPRLAEWTPDMRQDQIGRIEAAREHDGAAIAALREALEALKQQDAEKQDSEA